MILYTVILKITFTILFGQFEYAANQREMFIFWSIKVDYCLNKICPLSNVNLKGIFVHKFGSNLSSVNLFMQLGYVQSHIYI